MHKQVQHNVMRYAQTGTVQRDARMSISGGEVKAFLSEHLVCLIWRNATKKIAVILMRFLNSPHAVVKVSSNCEWSGHYGPLWCRSFENGGAMQCHTLRHLVDSSRVGRPRKRSHSESDPVGRIHLLGKWEQPRECVVCSNPGCPHTTHLLCVQSLAPRVAYNQHI